jgi:hypothetical protein
VPHAVALSRRTAALQLADLAVVLFAGQIRPDKRLELAIEASAQPGREHLLAGVGEDRDLERPRELAAASACKSRRRPSTCR